MHATALASSDFRAPRRRRSPLRTVAVTEEADEALIAAIAGGDRRAFARAFAKFAPKVKSYLLRLGAPAALAEDLAQDAMVSVWRRASSFDAAKAKASTWIFVIARNAWIDRLRREKTELAYRATVIPVEESDDEAPDAAAARSEDEARVRAVMDSLSDEQRRVVELSFFEDISHSEIAERMAIPLGTVKSRLRLALAKLRARWDEQP